MYVYAAYEYRIKDTQIFTIWKAEDAGTYKGKPAILMKDRFSFFVNLN
jgi:hypothetical protein